jgi:hypothetical protein
MPTSRSGTAHHAKVEGEARGTPSDDLTLTRLACHALHREQRVVVWPGLPQELGIPLWGGFVCGAPVRIRLALFPERHPRDCRYLTRDYLPSEDCHYRREAAQQP